MSRPNYCLGPYLVTDKFGIDKRDNIVGEIQGYLSPVSHFETFEKSLSQCELWIPNKTKCSFVKWDGDNTLNEIALEITPDKLSRQIERFKEFYENALKHIEPQTQIFYITFGLVSYYS